MSGLDAVGRRFRAITRDGASMSEAALMQQVAAGRMDAFESLYRLYYPRLVRFIERITRRPPLTEEVLDDTMLVVWRKAHTFTPGSRVSTWIFAIAYRQALRALRGVDDAVEFAEEVVADASRSGPESASQRQEVHTRIEQALDALSTQHRAVIELTYYFGYSCAEIARIVDCPVDTVKTRMFYARRRLKGLLGLDGEEAM